MSTLAHELQPARVRATWAADAVLIVLGSLVVALLAQVSIHLRFVPITGQTLGVLLVAAALGSVRGGMSIALYLAEGAVGLPVFAEGKSGLLYLTSQDPLHVTGGYLWGFLVAAVVVGYLAQRGWDRKVSSALGAMLVGNIIIFVFGVAWLAAALDISAEKALQFGLYPFVVGDILKLLFAAGLLPGAWRLVGHNRL